MKEESKTPMEKQNRNINDINAEMNGNIHNHLVSFSTTTKYFSFFLIMHERATYMGFS